MTVKQRYQKERKNYLARVRSLEKLGYQVERIPTPKKPTNASIRRLNKETTRSMKFSSKLVDVITGEIVTPKGAIQRKKLETKNKANIKFANEIFNAIEAKGEQPAKTVHEGTATMPHMVDITIDNLYDSIELFPPQVQMLIKEKLDKLMGDGSDPLRREALAKTIEENPEYLPTPADSKAGDINYKFEALERIFRLNQEEMRELQDIAESNMDI